MPSPKSKSSPKGKTSPKGKNSPKKSPKGKHSPKDKIKDIFDEPFVYQKPPPPPPPPDPPEGPLLSRLRRQVWYPYANRITLEHREWFWSPYCPLITSWGDIFVSDPPQRRILRYCFNPISAKIVKYPSLIIVKGEPRIIIEIPRTGRIACLSTCPKAKKTALILYDPITLKEENRIDFKYQSIPSSENENEQPNDYKLEDDSTPIGMCSNSDLLFVLFNPIQKLRIYDSVTLKSIDLRLENAFPDESTCIHLATSGGCAASENALYVAATRPPRVQMFWVNRQRVLSQMDRIDVTWYSELSLDRISIGEPYGIQIDSLGLLVVSDSRGGYMRVYNTFGNKRPPGPWLPSLPHGETCYLGSWKIDPYQSIRPGHFSLGKNGVACIVDRWSNKLAIICDRTIFRWYDETLLALDDALILRPVIDPLMPINGLPALPMLSDDLSVQIKRSSSLASLPMPDDILLTEAIIKRYQLEDESSNAPVVKSSSPKLKKSPKGKSPKRKSPKSTSSKSKKKK
ncbi:unnamed protein product [Trichobilharzia szidati]|nr:unnamed protein product [Trichobilharzia szidati]